MRPAGNRAINRGERRMVVAADTSSFAGILTVAASLVVVTLMFVASHIDHGDPS